MAGLRHRDIFKIEGSFKFSEAEAARRSLTKAGRNMLKLRLAYATVGLLKIE
jgi:hypothetical protein